MVETGIVRRSAGNEMLRNFDLGRRLAGNPAAGGDADRDGLPAGTVGSDIGDQPKTGEARIRVVRVGFFDVAAHSAELRRADALAIDEPLDRLDLDETDNPAFEAKHAASVDAGVVDIELHRQRPGLRRPAACRVERVDDSDIDL